MQGKYIFFVLLNFFLVIAGSCVYNQEDIGSIDRGKGPALLNRGENVLISDQPAAIHPDFESEILRKKILILEAQMSSSEDKKGLLKQVMDLQLLLRRYRDAFETGRKLLLMGSKDGSLTYKMALAAFRQKKFIMAENIIAGNACGDTSDCLNLSGLLLYRKGNIPEAVGAFKKSLIIKPDNIAPSLNLLTLYLEYHKYNQAWEEVNGLLRQNSSESNALLMKALLLHFRNKSSESEELLDRLAGQNPDNPLILYNMAVAYGGQKKISKALKLVGRALKNARSYGIDPHPLIKLKEKLGGNLSPPRSSGI